MTVHLPHADGVLTLCGEGRSAPGIYMAGAAGTPGTTVSLCERCGRLSSLRAIDATDRALRETIDHHWNERVAALARAEQAEGRMREERDALRSQLEHANLKHVEDVRRLRQHAFQRPLDQFGACGRCHEPMDFEGHQVAMLTELLERAEAERRALLECADRANRLEQIAAHGFRPADMLLHPDLVPPSFFDALADLKEALAAVEAARAR